MVHSVIRQLCPEAAVVDITHEVARMRIDPALSAGVILTTFTDCIGFATLLFNFVGINFFFGAGSMHSYA